MKKTLSILFTILLSITILFSTINIAQANGLQIDQGTLKTGQSRTGHAATYSSRMVDGSSGETSAKLKPLGGVTVWIQLGGSPSSRKSKSGTYNQVKDVKIWIYGRSLEHGYTGISPAY